MVTWHAAAAVTLIVPYAEILSRHFYCVSLCYRRFYCTSLWLASRRIDRFLPPSYSPPQCDLSLQLSRNWTAPLLQRQEETSGLRRLIVMDTTADSHKVALKKFCSLNLCPSFSTNAIVPLPFTLAKAKASRHFERAGSSTKRGLDVFSMVSLPFF